MPDLDMALLLVKTRLNRSAADISLDEYLIARIQGAQEELNGMLPWPLSNSTSDLLLLTDYAVWQYQCRDQSGAQPDWLRKRLRERFLHREGGAAP